MERSDRRGVCACSMAASVARQHAAGSVLYQMLLTLSAITLWAMLFAAFAAIGGCSQPASAMSQVQCSRSEGRCGHGHWRQQADRPRTSLIFPAEPGLTPIPADQIARADWPTTEGRTSYGQTVYYQQYVYDQQAIGPFSVDYGYKTSSSWTTGQQSGQ